MEEQDGKESVINKRGWDKSPSLSIIGLSRQDAVVEWALLR